MSAMNLPGNPHAERFLRSVAEFGEAVISEEGQTDATIVWAALADLGEAVLANAHEQRTANLFEFMQWVRAQGDIDGSTKLHTKIVNRLGLRDDAPEPVKHYQVGPGKCDCGFDAYRQAGVTQTYDEALTAHFRRHANS